MSRNSSFNTRSSRALGTTSHVFALLCTGLFACGTDNTPAAAPTTSDTPTDTKTYLPFDPLDDTATFTATLLVENSAGEHPAASLEYAGTTYSTDDDGKLVIPNVQVKDQQGLRLRAEGYLSRSVTLDYLRTSSSAGMRVVLETAGVTREFSAEDAARVIHGPITVDLPANAFANQDGSPYTGTVHAAALGTDPVQSMLKISDDGIGLREDFDLDSVPQGFGLATDSNDHAHFLLPESILQLELTADDGSPLQLQDGKQAQIKFSLSGISVHQAGDVLPMYTFDQTAQHWVEAGQCTVETTADDMLVCSGSTSHFSTWMISSGSDQTKPACGNLQFRVKFDKTLYESDVRAIQVDKVYGRDALDGTFTNDLGEPPSATSTSGACFFQAQSFAYVRVLVTLRRIARVDGQPVDEQFSYVLGKSADSAHATQFAHNLQLARGGTLSTSDLSRARLDTDCSTCPISVVDLDLTDMQATTTLDPCATKTCGPGATCVKSGACTCTQAGTEYKDSQAGCVQTQCDAPKTWDTTTKACVTPDACASSNGGCDSHASCMDDGTGKAVCTCRSGYTGDGQTCSAIVHCGESTCLHGGTCKDTADGYTCSCASGWEGANCQTNINECMAKTKPCDSNATCTDSDGSFSCACNAGYTGAGTPGTCANIDACVHHACEDGYACNDLLPPATDSEAGRMCVAVTEDGCASANGGCGEHADCSSNQGQVTCTCQTGYAHTQAGACIDVDACQEHPCDTGYACTDLAAPALNDEAGRSCTDIDACINHPCDEGYACTDSAAPAPDDETGRACEDIDECSAPTSPCGPNSTCLNQPGYYSCPCDEGYSPQDGACVQDSANGVDLTSGQAGELQSTAADFDNVTYGVELEYMGLTLASLTGVQLTGFSNITELYARLYNSSGQTVASGSNTSVTGDTATVMFTMSYFLNASEPLTLSVWAFGTGATLTLFEPMSFDYTESTSQFHISGAASVSGDNEPTEASTGMPQLRALVEGW